MVPLIVGEFSKHVCLALWSPPSEAKRNMNVLSPSPALETANVMKNHSSVDFPKFPSILIRSPTSNYVSSITYRVLGSAISCFKFELKLLLSTFSVTSVESISRLSLRFSHCWERLVREILGHRSRVTSSHDHLATVERTTF